MPKDTPARRAARDADRARRLALVPPPPPPREPNAPGIWLARVDGQVVRLKVVALQFVSGHRAVPHDYIPGVGWIPKAASEVYDLGLFVDAGCGSYVKASEYPGAEWLERA